MNILARSSLLISTTRKYLGRGLYQVYAYDFTKLYSKNHEWIEYAGESNTYRLGITDHAQEQLGEIVFVDASRLNKFAKKCDTIAVIESVKTTADLYAPADGKVVSMNPELENQPSLINEKPE